MRAENYYGVYRKINNICIRKDYKNKFFYYITYFPKNKKNKIIIVDFVYDLYIIIDKTCLYIIYNNAIIHNIINNLI